MTYSNFRSMQCGYAIAWSWAMATWRLLALFVLSLLGAPISFWQIALIVICLHLGLHTWHQGMVRGGNSIVKKYSRYPNGFRFVPPSSSKETSPLN